MTNLEVVAVGLVVVGLLGTGTSGLLLRSLSRQKRRAQQELEEQVAQIVREQGVQGDLLAGWSVTVGPQPLMRQRRTG